MGNEISTFSPDTFLQYMVIQFGIQKRNSRMSILSGCGTYFNDIIVYSGFWNYHIQQLFVVFWQERQSILSEM